MPPSATRTERSPGRQHGFALIIVLWTLVLLALLGTHLLASGRSEARIALNLRANAAAEAAADGAVYEAIFHLIDASDFHWNADGAPHRLAFGRTRIEVRITPLTGKINPNTASAAVLSALLRQVGDAPDHADTLAAAIVDWRMPGTHSRPFSTKLAAYRAAGLDHAPPGAPFESLDELDRVLGMTPALLQALRPHLSLYQSAAPDPNSADPVVAAAVQSATAAAAEPAAAPPPDQIQTVVIEATAVSAEGGRFSRRAIVRAGSAVRGRYALLAWNTGPEE
jgi:general secretion pathway protein K